MSKEDEKVMFMVKASKKWLDGRYEVRISWKDNKVKLQNKYSNALNRLTSTEEKNLKMENLPEATATFSVSTTDRHTRLCG